MPLTFASVVPHSPVLIPTIGKEHSNRLSNTKKAYDKLKNEPSFQKAEIIIIVSPHGLAKQNCFTLNLSPQYQANLEEFGDFSTKLKFKGDIGLAYKIREKLEVNAKLQMITSENLDYGVSIPLFFLLNDQKNKKIIPFYSSGLSLEDHFNFGKKLGKEITKAKEKIAVVVSGDLSHRLTKNSPAGFSPKAKKIDNKIITCLRENNINSLLKIEERVLIETGECALKPILILTGILDGIRNSPQLLSYESPFGVGYMVMNFKLP